MLDLLQVALDLRLAIGGEVLAVLGSQAARLVLQPLLPDLQVVRVLPARQGVQRYPCRPIPLLAAAAADKAETAGGSFNEWSMCGLSTIACATNGNSSKAIGASRGRDECVDERAMLLQCNSVQRRKYRRTMIDARMIYVLPRTSNVLDDRRSPANDPRLRKR